MQRINLNHVARLVAEMEGGKVNLPIAQIAEVISKYNKVLTENYTPAERVVFFERLEDRNRSKKQVEG
jgi:hypothetical protein